LNFIEALRHFLEESYSDRDMKNYQTIRLVEFLMPKYTKKRRKFRISRQSAKRRNKKTLSVILWNKEFSVYWHAP